MKLQTYLNRKKISPSEFAGIIGVESQSVYIWLRGTSVPNQNSMRKIMEATKNRVKPNDFFPAASKHMT